MAREGWWARVCWAEVVRDIKRDTGDISKAG